MSIPEDVASSGLNRDSTEREEDTVPIEMEAPLGNGVKPPLTAANQKAIDDVMYSDIGINTLLNRLKQSIASAKDFSTFLKERSALEEKHAQGLRKLSKTTYESARNQENRQGSYARQLSDVTRAHERMADHGLVFSTSLHQMHEDLNELSNNMEKSRKQWKHEGLDNEKKVKDAESAMEKAKSKYDTLAESYDKARTGDTSGRVFGIKGPKSAEQREEDLLRKVQAADSEYSSKVDAAQAQRQSNLSTLRPKAVRALQELISECDAALVLQLQKFASFNEKLIVSNGLTVSPVKDNVDGAASVPSMREMIQAIDNDRDFQSFVTSHTSSLPPKPAEIRYEKHPSLAPTQTSPLAPRPPTQPASHPPTSSVSQVPPTLSVQTPSSQPPSLTKSSVSPPSGPIPIAQSFNSGSPVPSQPSTGFQPGRNDAPDRGFRGPPSAGSQGPPYPSAGPPSALPLTGPPPANYGPYRQPGEPVPYTKAPPQPANQPQRGPNGGNLPSYNPVFGMNLDALFRRDESAVPLVVYQCIQAVDLFGLDVEGIYRLSGNAHHIQQLKAAFDHDSSRVDFRNPSSFHHDVNSVAGLLKTFFRELPDPLFTAEHYAACIDAARIDDPTLRRDSLHAVINGLPDPNYATLRALVLHLNRVQEHAAQNRMSSSNIAICFAPTLMGQHHGHMADAGLQARVLDTILQNVYQIFDED